MTQRQFNDAIEQLMRGHDGVDEHAAPVVVAAAYVLKARRRIPDEVPWSATPNELAEFLAGLDMSRRRQLRQLANSLQLVADGGVH
jgi:hypothetical protein